MSRKVAREAAETEANEGGSEYFSSWLPTLLFFLYFRQPPLPPTKLGAAKPSVGQPTALTNANPVWSILSPALGIFSPALYAIE